MKKLILLYLLMVTSTVYPACFFPADGTGVTPEVEKVLAGITDGQKIVQFDDMKFRVEDLEKGGFSGPPWTNGQVYYTFHSSITSEQATAWVEAAENWPLYANVTFIPRTSQANYISVFPSTSNSSFVGMIGGAQNMEIASWDSEFIIAHEIGHALGMCHEHSRPDRNSYVTILFENIQEGKEHNFELRVADVYGSYDFDSVMHYSGCAFSIDCPAGSGCDCTNATIIVDPPNEAWQSLIGQRDYLSYWDRCSMAGRYGAPIGQAMFVDSTSGLPEYGTYCYPYHQLSTALGAAMTGETIFIIGGDHNYAPITIDQWVVLGADDGEAMIY